MSARKGLKRLGMRRYLVEGPDRAFEIERARPGKFLVREFGMPNAFFNQAFRRLFEARRAAEYWAEVNL